MFHFPTIQTSFGLRINENLFEAHLLTKCAYSECEPQGGEIASAELDGQYKRLRRVVAKLAHKAQWHGFSRFVLQTSRMPFVACNELAIVTKSIASVCPHAERTPWVPFQGGTAVGETREEGGNCI